MQERKKRRGMIVLLACMCLAQLSAQYIPEEDPYDRKGKFFLIPEFWLSFGSSTYIDVAPMLGYHLTDRLVLGAGPHYIFQSWKSVPGIPGYQTHVFGLKGFARFALITGAEQFLPIDLFSDLFVHMEYEGMSLENGAYRSMGDEPRYLSHVILVGGGFNQRVGPRSSVSFMVLWNLNESYASPYTNPVFRVGFNTFF